MPTDTALSTANKTFISIVADAINEYLDERKRVAGAEGADVEEEIIKAVMDTALNLSSAAIAVITKNFGTERDATELALVLFHTAVKSTIREALGRLSP